MKVKRRVLVDKDNKTYKEIIEQVTLIKRNSSSVLVRLKNGDIIKRKLKDVVDLNEKEEQK